MRHNKKFNHLSRTSSHRKAMLANMSASLIKHKRINTTLAKAKALRPYIEPIITKSKNDTTHSRRVVFSLVQDKYAVAELFREVAPKVADRPGGYTRIIKLGTRLGDNAEMAMIELVDFNENLLSEKATRKAKTTRRGGARRAAEKTEETVAEKETVEEVKAEATEEVKAEAKVEQTAETEVEPQAGEEPKETE